MTRTSCKSEIDGILKPSFRMLRKLYTIFLPILVATTFLFLPIFINPDIFLSRHNDLQEFFWPIYYFVKTNLLENGRLPLWNNLFLSGTPLLPDPQAPLFYPPNIIYLLFNLNTAFIVSSFLHVFAGGIGMYYLARKGLNFSSPTSSFAGIIYVLTPRLTGYLKAGHIGLVASWAWVPLAALAVIQIVKEREIKWCFLLGASMAGLFFTHTVTFMMASIASGILFLSALYLKKEKLLPTLKLYLLGALVSFGLVAISFLPQLAWKDLTTRSLLISKPQIYPIWHSKIEFLQATFSPWLLEEKISSIDTEKWIPLGIALTTLGLIGFIKVGKKIKIILALFFLVAILVALGNTSPFYSLLISMNWFKLARVPTRVWFLFFVPMTLLAAYGVEQTKLKLNKLFLTVLVVFTIFEFLFLSYSFWEKPTFEKEYIPHEFYEIIQDGGERFRVLCLTRCIPQNEAAKRKIELVEGYSTLTQLNYYQHSWQLVGSYWDYYALPTPPTGVYLLQDLQPNAKSLGEYNTKYVISNHPLKDESFALLREKNNFLLYENKAFQKRSSGEIVFFSPNKIVVDVTKVDEKNIILSEVFSPGWKAYLDGTTEVPIEESPSRLRSVNIGVGTSLVEFVYKPQSYLWGRIITFSTYSIIFIFLLKNLNIKVKKKTIKSKNKNRD